MPYPMQETIPAIGLSPRENNLVDADRRIIKFRYGVAVFNNEHLPFGLVVDEILEKRPLKAFRRFALAAFVKSQQRGVYGEKQGLNFALSAMNFLNASTTTEFRKAQ